jgi:hypothetical protein
MPPRSPAIPTEIEPTASSTGSSSPSYPGLIDYHEQHRYARIPGSTIAAAGVTPRSRDGRSAIETTCVCQALRLSSEACQAPVLVVNDRAISAGSFAGAG